MVSLIVCFTLAQPPLTLPEEVKGKVGEFLIVKATTEGKTVRWLMLDPGANLLPPELLRDPSTAVVFSLRPGKFRLLAYSAKADEPTLPKVCLVIVESDTPPPPPEPVPPPSDLGAKLQAAFAADRADATKKGEQLRALTGLYQAMADHVKADTSLKTLGDVLGDLQRTAKAMVSPDALVECRKIIAAEISAVLGSLGTQVLDATLRARAVETFARIAKALEGVR